MDAQEGTVPEPVKRNHLSALLSKKVLTSSTALLAYLATLDFAIHMPFAGNYGYFRDELYYIVSGTQHLSLGYVDFPPFVAYVAALLNLITGDSLVSIHVVSALAEALLVLLSGFIVRELGGGRKAQVLAAVCTLVALVFLADGSEFSPDPFDQIWWSLLAYVIIRTIKRREPKFWMLAGVVLGIGLLTKLDILFFAGALVVSFVAIGSSRKYLWSKWVAVAALISFVFVVPMIYWNAANGWPMLQFYLEFRGDVGGGGPLSFFLSQVELLTFLDFPIAIIGLYFYLRSKAGSELRAFGLAYLILFVVMATLNFKPYYLAPAYPVLLAGGALLIEGSSVSRKGLFRWFGSVPYVAVLAVIAILLAPLVMPILPPANLVNTYGASTVAAANGGVASGEAGPLPQNLGDRLGWSAMVSTVAQVYDRLSASERSQACIFASNYGEASAINFLGRGLGLPKAISGHNNYYIWGPDSCGGQVLITIGIPLTTAQQEYANVTLMATTSCKYCMDLENNVPVLLCTHPTFSSIAAVWPKVKQYD